jgi:hypothetical protein
MKMRNLAIMLLQTAEQYGDREVVLMEEGTGEIRYVEGISFDAKGDTISIEHLGYSDMLLAREMEEYIEDDDDVDFSPNAVVEPMDLMEMLAILGGM